MSHRCTRYRHSGTTMTNTAIPTAVTAARATCAQASPSSTTNHTTWPMASTSHGIAAPIAHANGALRLGGFAGSTRSIDRPPKVQAFGDAEEVQGAQGLGGQQACDLCGGDQGRRADI